MILVIPIVCERIPIPLVGLLLILMTLTFDSHFTVVTFSKCSEHVSFIQAN